MKRKLGLRSAETAEKPAKLARPSATARILDFLNRSWKYFSDRELNACDGLAHEHILFPRFLGHQFVQGGFRHFRDNDAAKEFDVSRKNPQLAKAVVILDRQPMHPLAKGWQFKQRCHSVIVTPVLVRFKPL